MLVYPKEKPLFHLAVGFSALVWLLLVVGTAGLALVYMLLFLLGYLFAQSGFVSHVRGSGVRLSKDQLPELYERLQRCCTQLEMTVVPEAYILNAEGLLNALATRFLRRHYVVLFSDVIDSLREHPGAIDFYMGHELGHIKRGHLSWAWFLWPASLLPVIGAAYSRAREYTCDLHGLACCEDPHDAAIGLAVLAAGERSLDELNLNRFARQSEVTGSFWMSFHELTGDYPWLTKRMKALMARSEGQTPLFPARHPIAWLLALFVPRVAVGGGGSGVAGMMAMVAMVGILAAIAVPNFVKFQARARVVQIDGVREEVQSAATRHILETRRMPESLDAMGLADVTNAVVTDVTIDGRQIVLALAPMSGLEGTELVLGVSSEGGELVWSCDGDLPGDDLERACGRSKAAAGSAGEPGAAAHGTSPKATPQSCGETFRATPGYRAMSESARQRHRQQCNLLKLQQLGG